MEDKLKEAVKVYNKIASIYSKYNYHKLMQFQLTKFSSLLKGKRVLDAGCGIGRDVEYLMEEGLDVVGIDIAKNMIAEAKKNVPKGQFKTMDFRKMKFKVKSFDGIWCMHCLEHIDKKEILNTFKEFNRVLDAGGIFYLAVYEGEGEKKVVKTEDLDDERVFVLYKEEEMKEFLVESGFTVLSSEVSVVDGGMKWLEVYAEKKG